MTEQAITALLNSTGGIFCSFADVACPGAAGGAATDSTGVSGDWRYIETLPDVAGRRLPGQQRRAAALLPTQSANLLGTLEASRPARTPSSTSAPDGDDFRTVNLAVLPFTPVRPVPTLSIAMLVALLAAMAAGGMLALRQAGG
jgi:hypothetical protein